MKPAAMIPDQEYRARIQRAAELAAERGLDVLVVNSNEADFANVRYFSRFWPLFETAGVAIAPDGRAALMVGPESSLFAQDVGKIRDVFVMLEYRESADPSYPHIKTVSYRDVFRFLGVRGRKPRIGVGGWLVTTVVQMEGLRSAFPDAEIVRADDIMVALRSIKSENELACLREAYRIVEAATAAVIERIRPGMTELELVGIAQESIYANGAEYEGLPLYVFSELSTRHAISRASYRTIGKGDLVQVNLSARVDGYSPSIGVPVSMGPLVGEKRELVEFCLEAHRWTQSQLAEGVPASRIASEYVEFFEKHGRMANYVYGPCHGLGMIEVEPPWMETTSDYTLKAGMTFQIDTFASAQKYGMRWETGAVIRPGGCTLLSKPLGKIYEISV